MPDRWTGSSRECWLKRTCSRNRSNWHSITVIFWGFTLSSLIGVPIGVLCGTYPAISKLQEPFIEFFR
jgi:NitT/TauT family transport system permease protein